MADTPVRRVGLSSMLDGPADRARSPFKPTEPFGTNPHLFFQQGHQRLDQIPVVRFRDRPEVDLPATSVAGVVFPGDRFECESDRAGNGVDIFRPRATIAGVVVHLDEKCGDDSGIFI